LRIGLARDDVDFPAELVRVDLANREATESARQDLKRRPQGRNVTAVAAGASHHATSR
jgi:hypothetical protein